MFIVYEWRHEGARECVVWFARVADGKVYLLSLRQFKLKSLPFQFSRES